MKAVSHKKLVLVLYNLITLKHCKITVTHSAVEKFWVSKIFDFGKKKKEIYTFSKNTFNLSKVTIETFTILQNNKISSKCCLKFRIIREFCKCITVSTK